MKNIYRTIILLSILAVTSCVSVTKTSSMLSVSNKVTQYPTVADLTVSPQRVEKTVSWKFIDQIKHKAMIVVYKTNLIADILKEEGADVLVEPRFIHSKKGVFAHHTLTVSGYPAKMNNFRDASLEDVQALAIAKGIKQVYLISQRPSVVEKTSVDTMVIEKEVPVAAAQPAKNTTAVTKKITVAKKTRKYTPKKTTSSKRK